MEKERAFPVESCQNCRFMSKINYCCCFKLLSWVSVLCRNKLLEQALFIISFKNIKDAIYLSRFLTFKYGLLKKVYLINILFGGKAFDIKHN